MDSTVAGTAQFTSLYIGAQLHISQILEKGFWANPGTIATQQANNLKTSIQNLLQHCLKLQFFFVGLSPIEQCAVKQFRLRALALNLVYIVKGEYKFINYFPFCQILYKILAKNKIEKLQKGNFYKTKMENFP